MFFSRLDGKHNLFYTTDNGVFVYYDDLSKKRKLQVSGGTMFDLRYNGTLIGVSTNDNFSVKEFNLQNEMNSWNFGSDNQEKILIKYFK